jgi:hypothetical protein
MYVIAVPMLVVLCFNLNDPVLSIALPSLAALFLALSFMFSHLTVRDESEKLVIEFGPLHLFRKRVAYADINEVLTMQSGIIDGWGIHYMPGRGWIWNISGFDCVMLKLKDNRQLRIGTDDPAGLCAFLRTKIQRS